MPYQHTYPLNTTTSYQHPPPPPLALPLSPLSLPSLTPPSLNTTPSLSHTPPSLSLNAGGGLKPLDINGARKLQLVTEMYQKTKYGSGGGLAKGGGGRRRSATIHMGD